MNCVLGVMGAQEIFVLLVSVRIWIEQHFYDEQEKLDGRRFDCCGQIVQIIFRGYQKVRSCCRRLQL